MMLAGIALGSNLGDREVHLQRAIEALKLRGKLQVASFYETEPVDCPEGSEPFLNTVAILEEKEPPRALWEYLKELEANAGRPTGGERGYHAPRTLDLDLLFVDDLVLQEPDLVIPHPRMMDRLFVLEPLAELMPDFRPVSDGPTVREQLEALKSHG